MGNSIQEMRDAQQSDVVIIQEYLVNKNRCKYFGFIEGKEDYYYFYDWFEKVFNNAPFMLIKCNGKRNMATAIPPIEKNKDNVSVMFMMDGDYCNKTSYKNLLKKYERDFYILDAYSIENLFCSEDCLKKILKREYNIREDSDDLRDIVSDYNSALESGRAQLEILNYFFYIQRVLRKNDVLDLSIIRNSEVLLVDRKKGQLVFRNQQMETLCSKFDVPLVNDDELKMAKDFFKDKSMVMHFRGHNMIAVIQNYIRLIHQKNNDGAYSRVYSSIGCCSDTLLNHCVYAAEVPQSLLSFWENHKIV